MTKEKYFEMIELLGTEPLEEEIPTEFGDFPLEVQQIIEIYGFLSDVWDMFGGNYLGKDYSILPELFSIFKIEDKKLALILLKNIDNVRIDIINQKVKAREAKNKAKNKKV